MLGAKLRVSLCNEQGHNDVNSSAGIGIGFRMRRGILDVAYAQVNPPTDYITIGYIMPF